MAQKTAQLRERRHGRIRAKIKGIPECFRLCVFRSNNHITAQLIDDTTGQVKAHASDAMVDKKGIEGAKEVGKRIASLGKKIEARQIVFDRGGYRYHGKVKALAEGAREGGLQF
ncbi:MAG: 50S ribosomal protein L18 [bacterium]|nr:50S ribosomal protein L18 [bacterium]